MGKSAKMTTEEIQNFLNEAPVARFSTIDAEGYPYTIAVNFVYFEDCIFIHGKGKGEKIGNLQTNACVGFEVDELYEFMDKDLEMPCDIYANYRSVVIKGRAELVDDLNIKRSVLDRLVEKYLPTMENKSMPDKVINLTAVIKIEIKKISGKKHS